MAILLNNTAPVTVKLRKVGGSVVVSIPRRLLEEAELSVGENVQIVTTKHGLIDPTLTVQEILHRQLGGLDWEITAREIVHAVWNNDTIDIVIRKEDKPAE